jgi:23S rRNA (cytosine1962-C5)-methyltransferase
LTIKDSVQLETANTLSAPSVWLKPGREKTLLRGHPWIFSGALQNHPSAAEAGTIVRVDSHAGKPIAWGFYHPKTDIAVRCFSWNPNKEIDDHFWERQLDNAIRLRERVVPPETDAYRLINSEGDGFPGLIADRYGNHLVISVQTTGMEKIREPLIRLFQERLRVAAIYERSEGQARRIEGLENRIGWTAGTPDDSPVQIRENGLIFFVDIVSGQKTGFFLDQRTNREIVASVCPGKIVLNCFSYTGGFSVYCIRAGAKKVISVETSQAANEKARQNLSANGFSELQHPIVAEDVFSFLRETRKPVDVIVLDPPAFAKSKHEIKAAARGYKEINLQALRLLNSGGLLTTFSCSNYIDPGEFEKIILFAAQDAGKTIQLLRPLGPGADHPTLLPHFQGRYLKGFLIRVL